MWKIIIIFNYFIAVRASDVEKFYGTWTQVAFYPINGYVPACIEFTFDKDSRDIDCTCVDRNNVTLVEISLLLKKGNKTAKAAVDSYPLLVVESPNEVELNVECNCGEKKYTTRLAAKLVNANYFVMYEKNKIKEYTEAEPNDAYVFAKKVPKHADLIATLLSIEDLKKRSGAGMCASDVNLDTK